MRQHFGMNNVKSDVKKNYKAAESLMLSLTKANLCAAFMEWSGMETLDANPTKVDVPAEDTSETEWQQFLDEKVRAFVEEYVMFEFDRERILRESERIKKKTESQRQEDQGVPDKIITIEPG
jgi:hypothetical protein